VTTWTVHRASEDHRLDVEVRHAISALVENAKQADGISAIDDQVGIDLQHPSSAAVHLVASDDGDLVGYAHVDLRSDSTASGHLVVAPTRRREGIGRALAMQMLDTADGRRLAVWAHGNGSSAIAFATKLGWEPVRELRQLVLLSSTAIGSPSYPVDVTLRTFEPGRDEQAWVKVNAEAFADHSEQGRMTVADLEQREEQSWFDPGGLFLAERDGELLGSHWTKIHEHADGSRVGEVYVLGVSPRAQGLGLGKALTLTGLEYLRSQGLDVVLFVDADNSAALALYERIGFTTRRADVMYSPRNQLSRPDGEALVRPVPAC
jgi:mycothiol synthase